jgi:hypothetical protein
MEEPGLGSRRPHRIKTSFPVGLSHSASADGPKLSHPVADPPQTRTATGPKTNLPKNFPAKKPLRFKKVISDKRDFT